VFRAPPKALLPLSSPSAETPPRADLLSTYARTAPACAGRSRCRRLEQRVVRDWSTPPTRRGWSRPAARGVKLLGERPELTVLLGRECLAGAVGQQDSMVSLRQGMRRTARQIPRAPGAASAAQARPAAPGNERAPFRASAPRVALPAPRRAELRPAHACGTRGIRPPRQHPAPAAQDTATSVARRQGLLAPAKQQRLRHRRAPVGHHAPKAGDPATNPAAPEHGPTMLGGTAQRIHRQQPGPASANANARSSRADSPARGTRHYEKQHERNAQGA